MQLTNAILKSSRHAAALTECLASRDIAAALKLVSADLGGSDRDIATWSTLGALYRLQGSWERAAEAFNRALDLNPRYWAARAGLGCVRLTQGRYAEGWRGYRARWRLAGWRERMPYPPSSIWDGIARPGEPVLLWCGDDLGGAIQYVRYLPWLAAQGVEVRLQPPPALGALFATQWPGLLDEGAGRAGARHLPLSDLLATWQGVPAGTLVGREPYLRIAEAPAGRTLPAVGLACGSGDACLSAPVPREHWTGLRGAGFVEWVDLDELKLELPAEGLLPLARRIAGLDLVVTSDCTVAHLAGAMGRPAWVVLGPVPEPVWMLEREDSPWYPSVRLFRHDGGKDAERVLERVAQALAEWVCGQAEVAVLADVIAP